MKAKTVICIVDKEFPPNHSFVDGMLSRVLPDKETRVILVVSRGSAIKDVYKHNKAICVSALLPRRGIYRFLNVFFLAKLLIALARKYQGSSEVFFFIRNEPVYLLTASILRFCAKKIIFQQSFPHEKGSGKIIKRKVAVLLFRITNRFVDAIVTVSPRGLLRLRRHFTRASQGIWIPLLIERDFLIKVDQIRKIEESDTVRFVYVGTHAPSRQLEVVLKGIIDALSTNINATFSFIGGNKEEIDALRNKVDMSEFERVGQISFLDRVPRERLLHDLSKYDVGISLIPVNAIYAESSPTKLVEYMGKGLAVVGSEGIELQEKFIRESNGGEITKFQSESITRTIIRICSNKQLINNMKINARMYAEEKLVYEKYNRELRKLLW